MGPEVADELQQSRTQMTQFTNEMLPGSRSGNPGDTRSGGSRFKNQYLSSRNSGTPTKNHREAGPDQDKARTNHDLDDGDDP